MRIHLDKIGVSNLVTENVPMIVRIFVGDAEMETERCVYFPLDSNSSHDSILMLE